MASRAAHALLLAGLAALGCAGRFGRAGPGPPPRVVAPGAVRWRVGGPRTLEFVLDNSTDRAIEVPPPEHRAWIDVRPVDGGPSCHVGPDAPDLPSVRVNARSRLAVTVDLGAACRDLPPGDYRYDLRVDLPPVLDGPPARGDPLATASGALVVEAQAVPVPRAPQAVAPPGDALPPAPAIPRAPDPQAPPGTAGPPSSDTVTPAPSSSPRRDAGARSRERLRRGGAAGAGAPGGPPSPGDARRTHCNDPQCGS